ncbi:MAG TPA: hypothetical protein VHT75_04530 [Acidimicrobiales bacterium]|jgi:alkanesulfonate monooxygenase SsuD/methylene tetrahydromethanopterin reductase-like flavin-dependent oxidoreductase (luciferase family)|nr:hypothetical protein [Acidimicrobiales bacterium]
MGRPAVCYQVDVAAALTAAGIDVVLCGTDGVALAAAAAGGRTQQKGRLAVLVGRPADVADQALAMAKELFGGDAVVVQSPAEVAGAIADEGGIRRPG